jgi:hypothetical protein
VVSSYPQKFWICSNMTEQQRIDVLQDLAVRSATIPAVTRLAETVFSRLPHHVTHRDIASEALVAVQHLEYHQHPLARQPYGDYFQRPDLTIASGGNCEDLSTVLVALLRSMGVLAKCVWIEQVDRPINHVAVRVFMGSYWDRLDDESLWEWADPTLGASRFGESAYEAINRLGPALHPAEAKFRARRAYSLRSGHVRK